MEAVASHDQGIETVVQSAAPLMDLCVPVSSLENKKLVQAAHVVGKGGDNYSKFKSYLSGLLGESLSSASLGKCCSEFVRHTWQLMGHPANKV